MATKRDVVQIENREVRLSNLHKVLYPATKFTKGQVIDYYVRIAPFLLPHLKDRPVTLKRYPDGVKGQFFYEKDAPSFTPDWVKCFSVPRRGRSGVIHYILINDLPTLAWVANTASLELHPFLHRVPQISKPTSVVFDLDPGPGFDVLNCVHAATLVRELLEEMGLESFAKVSGSKGLQLYVPLNTEAGYAVTQPFAKALAQLMEERHPDLIVSRMAKDLRTKKVFIDWSQNSDFKTTVSVYSLRAKSDRPYVSLPISWDELTNALKRKDAARLYFEPDEALTRVERVKDLFAPVLTRKQKLPSEFLELLRPQTKSPPKSLETYRQKRDFAKTPEPAPSVPARSAQGSRRRFVVQKHAASHLHYDFRLEMHGTLKSWAVPKGPPLTRDVKRLAMATEDHPLEYLDFEGTIPKGQYGGGTVMVWDIGTYQLVEGNYYKGYLKFFLQGKKLKGEWSLRKSRDNGDARQNKWYWEKQESDLPPLSSKKDNQSALTSRTMQEIAEVSDRQWQSNRPATPEPRAYSSSRAESVSAIDLDSLPLAKVQFVPPMLAKPTSTVPAGANWQYEIKLDGYRSLFVNEDSKGSLCSRRGNRLNAKYPSIASAFGNLAPGTMLDGEIVALDRDGKPDFNALQRAKAEQLYFYAFDVLAFRGRDTMRLPLSSRRVLLQEAAAPLSDPVRLSPIFDFPVNDIVQAAREQGLEGIVAKRLDSIYESGNRSGSWLKYKTAPGQELVIGGYLPGPHVFDSLLVGYYDGPRLMFVGKLKNGFTPFLRREIAKKFHGLQTEDCPFANLPELPSARRGKAITKQVMKECRWLLPRLVAEVEFTEWTPGNHLRHSRFKALRDDKDPSEVVRES
jgi:bifunctional non-homologous end joining protein LigD